MTKCDICDRGKVRSDNLPLDICRRAACQPERDHLAKQKAAEYYDHWDILARFKSQKD